MQDVKKKPARIKKGNNIVFFFLRMVFIPALYLLFRFKFDTKSSKGIKRPCFILVNHQTLIDQFAAGMGFRFGINYIASETIFRHGLGSWLMKVIVRPIPFSKGNSDMIAVRNILEVVKDGGCVAMFPSGNRSFFGDECTIVPGIGKLAKKLNVPLVLMQLRGGFNTLARWKAKPNMGKMTAVVTRVVSPEELAVKTNAEVDEIIRQEIGFNEFEYNRKMQIPYRGRHKTEYLESVLFYCPECDSMTGLYSGGNEFYCRDCNARVRMNDTGFFERVNNADNIPETILEWSVKQLDFVKKYDFSGFTDKPLFGDDNVTLSKAERAVKEESLGTGRIELYSDKMVVCGHEFFFADTITAVHGVRKMTIYNKEGVYAVFAPYRINLVKYMICGYHLRNKILNIKEEYYGY